MLLNELITQLEENKKLYGNILVLIKENSSYIGISKIEILNCGLIDSEKNIKASTPVIILN